MSFSYRARFIRTVAVGAAVILSMAISGTARAQFGEAAGIAEAMQQDFFRRDIRTVNDGLKLDATQRTIVEALFGDYEAEFEAGLARMRKKFEEMREQLQVGDKDRIMKLVFAPFKDWNVEKAKLHDQFLENVKVVLTQDQIALWPAIERRIYREKKLAKSSISGEGLNLFFVVRDMQLDDRTELQIQPVMDAYDMALDHALHKREDTGTGVQNDMLDAMAEQNTQKRMEAMAKHIQLQINVRNVNDTYIENIAGALPEGLGRQFRAQALERGYPRIYRETPVQRMFKQAKELEGLSADVLKAIDELEASFLSELAGINGELLTATRDYEPVQLRARAEDYDRRMSGQSVEQAVDPTTALFARRDEMSRSYAKRLQALLTPEQFAKIPGAFRWVDNPQVQNDEGATAVQKKPEVPTKGVRTGTNAASDE